VSDRAAPARPLLEGPADFGLAVVAFGLLMFWRLPPWLVVLITAVGGSVTATFS
jgi:chromate transporter